MPRHYFHPKTLPGTHVATEDISSLVKFCTIESSLKILNSQSLRWSAAHLNNDPFELDYHSSPGLTPDKLLNGMIKEAINMLFGPSDPVGRSNKLVAAIARWRDEERFGSEEEAETVLKQLLNQVSEQQMAVADKLMASWKQFATTTRICSFSSKPGNLHCWQRYADNHAGIALKFACGKDTALPNPRRMTYSQATPEVTSLKQQVDISYGRQSPPETSEFVDKLLVKSKLDSDEREFRCFAADKNIDDDDQLWYSTKKFSAPELQAVYFGLNTPANKKTIILKLLKENYSSTKVFQAVKQNNRFDIDFEPIAKG